MKIKTFFFLLFCCGMIANSCTSSAQQTNLSVNEFEKAISKNNIQVLDVRTAEEYQSGHLAKALLANWNDEAEFKERAKALDKSKPVYTYCLGGVRSKAAAEWLKANGFEAYSLTGGINAWKSADKPVEHLREVKQMTMQEYIGNIPAGRTVLVDFGAVWCPPCKKMAPLLDSLVASDGSRFVLFKIDGGEQSEICKQMKIDGFPTFIVYKNGKEVWRKKGLLSAKEILEQL